ncbi:MAG: helix-turn-helix domain-containing protein [Oscillospiraceae bacterium]|nr:helix-turn-helix domain-containing protein [Oscillospiraceae bacterium]
MANRLKQDISIGVNLKKYRAESQLSQENVAAKLQIQGLDISREIISQMELGKYNIRVSVLLALAEMYRTPIQNFFADLERYE